ncbi:MAG: hypothetical protein WD768_14270 [Phycisphaeraceae bacterium]
MPNCPKCGLPMATNERSREHCDSCGTTVQVMQGEMKNPCAEAGLQISRPTSNMDTRRSAIVALVLFSFLAFAIFLWKYLVVNSDSKPLTQTQSADTNGVEDDPKKESPATVLDNSEKLKLPFPSIKLDLDIQIPPGTSGKFARDGVFGDPSNIQFDPPVTPLGRILSVTIGGRSVPLSSTTLKNGMLSTVDFGDIEVRLVGPLKVELWATRPQIRQIDVFVETGDARGAADIARVREAKDRAELKAAILIADAWELLRDKMRVQDAQDMLNEAITILKEVPGQSWDRYHEISPTYGKRNILAGLYRCGAIVAALRSQPEKVSLMAGYLAQRVELKDIVGHDLDSDDFLDVAAAELAKGLVIPRGTKTSDRQKHLKESLKLLDKVDNPDLRRHFVG